MNSQPKRARKILYVITHGHWGGAQRYVFDLANAVSKNNEVSVAIGKSNIQNDLQEKIAYIPGIKRETLQHLVRRISPLHDLLAIFELAELYRKLKPDVIHLNSSKAGILGSLATFFISEKPKIVYTVHGWVFNEPLPWFTKKMYRFLERSTARLKNTIIVLSSEEKKLGEKLGVRAKKLEVIPIGASPLSFYSPAIARQKILKMVSPLSPPSFWIGVIANLYSTKGVDLLIEAIHKSSHLQQFSFFILGTGPEKASITKQIENHKFLNVHLLGFVEEASKYINAFDLMVMPSRKEGLPYALLEILQTSVPIVATRVGGVPEVLADYPNAVLVEPTASEIAKGIEHALTQTRVSEKSLPFHYSLEEMVQRTENKYFS